MGGREHSWCPECDLVLSRHPVPAVHTVVHDDDTVLLLDEPIPQQEGVLSLPGGYTKYDEGPRAAALRELHEETALRADPADLNFLTIYHAEFPGSSLYFITSRWRARTPPAISPRGRGVRGRVPPAG